jgi:hypothetical protein
MTYDLKTAERMVEWLIADANRVHPDATWYYELTSDVENIEVVTAPITDIDAHTLRIHPCWLRYVVSQGDFKSCVVDEIEAWYRLEQLTGGVGATAA